MEELRLSCHFKNNDFENLVPADIVIDGDENAIRFIVRNLMGNAVKFTSGGTITIAYSMNETMHYISVNDTGIGIVLESSYYDNKETIEARKGTNNERGSGIGLSLVKEQLQKLEGGLEIESAMDLGTCVTIYFPRLQNY